MRITRIVLLAVVLLVLAVGVTTTHAQDNVIRIASQTPLSGPQSVLGVSMSNGVRLAIEQLSGPIEELGFTVEYVPFDDQATPEVGVSNAQQIVNDPSILGVVGHLNSGVAIPSSEVYNDNNLVMVSPANTNPLVTDRGYPTVNRVCGRDDLQGPTGATFATDDLGVTNVYILHDTTAYGQGLAEFFQQKALDLGLNVLGFEGTEEVSNFEGIIQPILALSPDLIFFGGIYSQTGVFIAQARAAGYEGLFMGGDGFDSSEFAALGGDAAVGTYYTSVAAPATVYPAAAQFIADYQAAYGEDPQPFAAQSYDSTGIILAAIQSVLESNGGVLPTREEVSAAVRATADYQGLTGSITFDANGDPVNGHYYVIQVASADAEQWSSNTIVATIDLPSPLTAQMEAEATPAS
ncbi:MAG: branched-chain amino acid ABC transporter substrate-binding protein [Anaerolineae bacterium]